MVIPEDRVDNRPSGLNRILTREKRAVACHRVAEKPLIGRFLSRLFIKQVQLTLVTDKILTCTLNASGERDGGVGGKAEAQIVGPTGNWR